MESLSPKRKPEYGDREVLSIGCHLCTTSRMNWRRSVHLIPAALINTSIVRVKELKSKVRIESAGTGWSVNGFFSQRFKPTNSSDRAITYAGYSLSSPITIQQARRGERWATIKPAWIFG